MPDCLRGRLRIRERNHWRRPCIPPKQITCISLRTRPAEGTSFPPRIPPIRRQWKPTGMEPKSARNPPKPRGKRLELARWLEREHPEIIGEREWDDLRTLLAPVSESHLRHLLRDAGVPLEPLVEGVRQDSLDTLESSLLRLLDEYEAGDRDRRVLVR